MTANRTAPFELLDDRGERIRFYRGHGSRYSFEGYFAGLEDYPGILTQGTGNAFALVFEAAGLSQVGLIAADTAFVFDNGSTARSSAQIIWGGHGNKGTEFDGTLVGATLDAVVPTIKKMVDHIRPAQGSTRKKFIVVALASGPMFGLYGPHFGDPPPEPDLTPTPVHDAVHGESGVNADLRTTFGADADGPYAGTLVEPLPGLLDLGPAGARAFAGATQPPGQEFDDEYDVAHLYPPGSLRDKSGGDVGHLNALGQRWITKLIYEKQLELGWFAS